MESTYMESIVLPSIKACIDFSQKHILHSQPGSYWMRKHIHYIRGWGNILCTNSMFNINEAVKVIVYGSL